MSYRPNNNMNGHPGQPSDDFPSFVPQQQPPPPRNIPMSYLPYMSGGTTRGNSENNMHHQMNGGHYNQYNGMSSYRGNAAHHNGGFNPNAPSFQPRQGSNRDQGYQHPSTAYGHQQQPRQRFDPFGYQGNRGNQPAANRISPSVQSYVAPPHPLYGSNSTPSLNGTPGHRGFPQTNEIPNEFHQLINQKVGDATKSPGAIPTSSGFPDSFGPVDADIAAYEAMYDFGGTSGGNQPVMIPLSPELVEQMHQSPNKQALFEIQVGLEQLIAEPDNFDAWSIPIRDRIIGKEISPEDRNTIAWLITEMAILVDNCQYNFAKLCQVLNESINGFAKDSLLPQLLEFHVMSQNNPDYLTVDDRRRFLTFYAELYEKLKVNSNRIPELAQGIIEQINDFISTAPLSDQMLKTIIHALKLCGRYLDADRHEALDQIFSTFHDWITSRCTSLGENAMILIKNVIVARGNHWGINDSRTNLISSESEAYDMVFYDGDGQPVTLNDEELAFFENCNRIENGDGALPVNGTTEDDDEYQEEYERFLQQQAEETALRIAEKALQTLSVDEEDLPNTPNNAKK